MRGKPFTFSSFKARFRIDHRGQRAYPLAPSRLDVREEETGERILQRYLFLPVCGSTYVFALPASKGSGTGGAMEIKQKWVRIPFMFLSKQNLNSRI